VERGIELNDTLREPAACKGGKVFRISVTESTWHKLKTTDSLISFSAFSTESEPWQMLRPTASAKSPRMVPILIRSVLTSQ
jgi:hypothetical protein